MSYFADEQVSLRVTFYEGSTRGYTVKRSDGEKALAAFAVDEGKVLLTHTQGLLALDLLAVCALDLHASSINAAEQSFDRVQTGVKTTYAT